MSDQTVWKATSRAYPDSPCHFGEPATAKAWAGPGGTVEEITIKGKTQTARPLRAVQNWSGMRGDIAFSIIERHADDWTDAGEMMEAWLEANGGTVPNAGVTGAEKAQLLERQS